MQHLNRAQAFVLRTMYGTAVCSVILVLIVNREYCSAANNRDKVSIAYFEDCSGEWEGGPYKNGKSN